MVLMKKLYLFCLNRPTSILRHIDKPSTAVTNLCACQFSTKKPIDRRSKTKASKHVKAENEFVTHQLNTSFAAHLKRQQKIWNQLQKDEKDEEEKRKCLAQRKSFQQKSHQVRDDNYYGHGHRNGYTSENRKEKCIVSDESSSKYFHRKSNYSRNHQIDNDLGDVSGESDSEDYSVEQLEVPNWDDIELYKINKDVYKPSDKTQNRQAQEVDAFRTKMQIKIDTNAPKPIFKFNELDGLTEMLIGTLKKHHFVECTPVQAQAIPVALTGANMLTISQSGSGKMLSMILSAVVHILSQDQSTTNGPCAVILAPTNESAEEIRQLAHVICESTNVKYAVFTKNCNKALTPSPLLISTADHLYETLRKKSLNLINCSYFALYDADKMIEMCMEEEIIQIASQIRSECQRLMWSTSSNGDVRELAISILHEFVRLDVGTTVPQICIAQNIKQVVKVSDEKSKEDVLNEVMGLIKTQPAGQRSLIFVETPANADKINSLLRKSGLNCNALHNGKSKRQRDETMSAFENGKLDVLVLTDTAAKNLQFINISNVIHFDMPNSIIDYTHRVNRTGRNANEIGTSFAIVTENDGHLAEDLIEILQQTNQDINPALFIMKAANADSDDEISFAIPSGKGFKTYTIDNSEK